MTQNTADRTAEIVLIASGERRSMRLLATLGSLSLPLRRHTLRLRHTIVVRGLIRVRLVGRIFIFIRVFLLRIILGL